MLDRKTVFVIGAGAGFDIGMPLGDNLAGRISEAVDFYFDSGKLTKGNAHVAEALQRIAKPGWAAFLPAGRMISSGIKYTRSIDNFVYSHSDKEAVKIVAKVAIVQMIIEAEKACAISIDPKNHPPAFYRREQSARLVAL
jgi:hypothetical protein